MLWCNCYSCQLVEPWASKLQLHWAGVQFWLVFWIDRQQHNHLLQVGFVQNLKFLRTKHNRLLVKLCKNFPWSRKAKIQEKSRCKTYFQVIKNIDFQTVFDATLNCRWLKYILDISVFACYRGWRRWTGSHTPSTWRHGKRSSFYAISAAIVRTSYCFNTVWKLHLLHLTRQKGEESWCLCCW